VLIGSVVTEYCVLNIALDAVENGFQTTIISDCVRGVYMADGFSGGLPKEALPRCNDDEFEPASFRRA
jgi:hypothetical protein